MTTEQKIEVLEKDILQRTGRNFTSVRTNGRLGQEDTSASGAVYSAAMLSPKDSADLHRMAYGHARDMIVAMNTPFRVRIALTPNVSCTDGRVVSVTAAHGTYDNKTKDIQVDGDVTIETTDGAALTCGKLLWTEAEGKLTAAEDAYIKQDDMQARADRIESTNGFSHFKAIGKAHIVKGAK